MRGQLSLAKLFRIYHVQALMLSTLFLSACAGASGTHLASSGVDRDSRPEVINGEVLEMEKKYYVASVIDGYNALNDKPDRQKGFRDEVINGRIYVIDYYYSKFRNDVRGGVKLNTNLVTDIAVLGLDAADAINPAKRAKEILLTISGGLTGPQASVDKDNFYDEAIPALVLKMDSLRLEKLVLIRQRMKYGTQGEYAYTLGAALIDVNDYFQSGTLSGAIRGITNSSGVAANKAELELRGVSTKIPAASDE
ncbi:MAG: hypothetical protein ACHQ6U_03900 [Thermodesulfobacteriota bacterium]